MSTIFEFRKGNAQRAEQARGWAVEEYKALMADLIERAKTELKMLKEVLPDTLKIIAAAERRYPPSAGDPDNVKKAVFDYGDALRLGRRICEINPVSIQNMIDQVEHCKPADFQKFSAKVLADEDRRRLSPLLNGSESLKRLPKTLEVLEPPIIEAMDYWKEREKHGAGWTPPATTGPTPATPDESKQLDEFDARIS